MSTMYLGILTCICLVWATICQASRVYVDLDEGWLFTKSDPPQAPMPQMDDSDWQQVDLPHDWSIEGPFGPQFASGTGYAPGGIGWYRRHFQVDPSWQDRLVFVEFDGIYNNAQVWLNGHYMGGRPYGYASFQLELTNLLNPGQDNLLAVRVDHSRFADSRWYTGSGIYRHVRLRIVDKLHIAHWGTFITTPQVQQDKAYVQIETTVENTYQEPRQFSLTVELIEPNGLPVARSTAGGAVGAQSNTTVRQVVGLSRPKLWSVEQPMLYNLISTLAYRGEVVDQSTQHFGIRTIRFDPNKGLLLNQKQVKIKGVCIHHDAGPLGAAVPEKVLHRRLAILKSIGVNAIRTSHNPPAPELLDICDRLGLMVMDEAFDEFTPAKNKWIRGWNAGIPSRFGYAEHFTQWAIRDIEDMVLRDRNHPCVILWSIGNEIDYPNDPFSHAVLGQEYRPQNPSAQQMVELARPLIQVVKRLDPTRPVTAALASVAMSEAVGLPQILDVVGYNYQEDRYQQDHARYPSRVILGSENNHLYRNWVIVRDNDFVAGQFLWTGIDYLGEAGPWPNKANRSGLLYLCGFKKPMAWFRQSLWSQDPMVYICCASPWGSRRRQDLWEHWNWPEGSTVEVICYTNCQQVRLSLNGRPLATTPLTEAVDGMIRWQVSFEPGELIAEGLIDGKVVSTFALRTAGKAQRIELVSDRTSLLADRKDICHVEFRVVDANGILVPDANHQIQFELKGPAKVLAIGNADTQGSAAYNDMTHNCYRGRGLAIIRTTRNAGLIRLSASCEGLQAGSCTLVSN